MTALHRQIKAARVALRDLTRAVERLMAGIQQLELTGGSSPRRKLTITPQRRAQLRLQGQYMGYMRQLKPRQKALARAAKERGGYRAGIKRARDLAGA